MTAFFEPDTPKPVMESNTDPDAPSTPDMQAGFDGKVVQ